MDDVKLNYERLTDMVRETVPCPDGVTRHTIFVVTDCPICRPECHDICGCGKPVTLPGQGA